MKTAIVSLISAALGIAVGILFAMCLKVGSPSVIATTFDGNGFRYPLEVFRKINEELPAKINNDDIMVVVLPSNGDYTIKTSVRGLQTRLSQKEWDKTFAWIRTRMGELYQESANAEPSGEPNGASRRRLP